MAKAAPQSALRYPLNIVLRSEAQVRVLRELARHGAELSAPALVMRTGLAQSSVREALIALQDTSVVESIGSERISLHRLRRDHPMAHVIEELFAAEDARFHAIFDAVRAAAQACGTMISAWIYGSVARGSDRMASDLDIAIVTERGGAPACQEMILGELAPAEDRLAFRPSVIVLDTEDVLRLSRDDDPWWQEAVRDSIPVAGEAPGTLPLRLHGPAKRQAS